MAAFRDRADAGRQLALKLNAWRGRPEVIVLGLPRGGVSVAAEVADALGAPLDVFLVHKVVVPGHDELAMGVIVTGGLQILNESVIRHLGIPRSVVERGAARERLELERRESLYRGERPYPFFAGKTVILVDDGLATAASVRAAATALRQRHPACLVVAVPVAPLGTVAALAGEADDIVCVETQDPFDAVSFFYDSFPQTTDAEVCELLERAYAEVSA